MNTSNISLKLVRELLGETFYIPAYQRGYRWTERQVSDLLGDVYAFQTSDENLSRDGFYCLQPIVVKQRKSPGGWEVVDGQQRITTLFLILQHLNQRFAEEYRKELYDIDFETRENSKDYLTELDETQAENNVDYHFIFAAHQTIGDWFTGKDHLVNDFESALLNRVKVIWYELPESENAIDAFTRLNIGKIPLTNAELIRALFLRSKNFPQATANLTQLKIAQEWDSMEKALQDDDFWYFLIKDHAPRPNRIEFIFDLITETENTVPKNNRLTGDDLYSFHYFNETLTLEETTPEDLWTKIIKHFQILEEWYRNKELFHLIGYLINEGETVLRLIRLSSESNGKRAFRGELKDNIFSRLLSDQGTNREEIETDVLRDKIDRFLNGLEYETNYSSIKIIKSTLLLFNIASIIANNQSIIRFRFDYFKKEKWDIEHIHPVTVEQSMMANKDKKAWLDMVYQYLSKVPEAEDLKNKAGKMIGEDNYEDDEMFETLYMEILKHFGDCETHETENGIGNLALLDSGTNRSYKNAVFPIKRERLLDRDREGTFVPLCTRNAFLKVYSEKVDNLLFWSKDDQKDYRAAMTETLTQFFTKV